METGVETAWRNNLVSGAGSLLLSVASIWISVDSAGDGHA